MLLIDYYIDVVGDNIRFDQELKSTHLNIQDGDTFVAKVTPAGVWLIKAKKEDQK
jgi:hypothetical protein